MENKKFKVGDEVYCILNGWGVVVQATTGERYTVNVTFENPSRNFLYIPDGRMRDTDITPTLYHQKVNLTIDLENEAQQLQQTDVSSSCFGRISESVFSELKSLDDLITKMGTTKDGYKNSIVGEPDDFKSRFKYFKEFLKKELPEFSEEEILKFDKHFQKFKKIYGLHGAEYFLNVMEYEARNNYR